ncbi:MAG: DUF3575 domain-containing protein [Prevotella sp.]|nr:DUF3575 domain-containing protein [Prevotella sp.]
MACRIVLLLLVLAAVSVSADAQDNYWTRKTRIQKTQPVQQKASVRTGQPVRQMPVVPAQPVPVAEPVVLPSLTPVPLVAAGVAADSLFIQFRLDSIRIDMDFAGNRQAWQSFERNFYQHYSHVPPRSIRLDIYSGASPEGSAAHNRWLGENRGIAIRRLVRQRLGSRVGGVIVHNEAARWDGLYDLLSASNEPWRDEALRIIEQTASADENQRDHREQQLRALRGGTAWPVLLEKYLSPLRSGATAILSLVGGRDTIVVRDTIVMECAGRSGYPGSAVVVMQGGGEPVVRKPALREPVWILRSNLPLLATGTPNLQAEWSLDHKNRWSVNAEGVWSWWTFAFNAYANEIMYGSVELRRWLGQRHLHHTLDGWHVGLGIGGGYGDLEWKSRGYQAEVYSAFVNIGWQRRFGRHRQWAFDAGIGLGYAYIPWRRYTGSTLFPKGHEEYHDDHLMWRETGRNNWVGTPHFNISLGYVFRQKNGAWRRQKALATEAKQYDYLHFRDSLMLREAFERDSARVARRLTPEVVERAAAGDAKAGRLKMRLDAKMQRLEEDLQHELQRVDMRYEQK